MYFNTKQVLYLILSGARLLINSVGSALLMYLRNYLIASGPA